MPVVRCRYYDVGGLADPARFAAGMEALPWLERRERAMRFRFGKDQRLCLGAGLLCARMLRAAGVGDLSIERGTFGKPYLAQRPDVHFNVSHSGTLVVCAVGEAPVGADVETRGGYDAGVAQMCFQGDELDWLAAEPDVDYAFTRLWTRKEAYLKLLGTGLSKPANSFSALPGERVGDGVVFWEHDVGPHHICVCTREQSPQDRLLFDLREVAHLL